MGNQKTILFILSIAIIGSFFAHTAYAANTVVATIPVGTFPRGIAYDSGKGETFVVNQNGNSVSVISDATNTVVATIGVGTQPLYAAYDSAKGEIFVTNFTDGTVSVISDATNTVVATITVGTSPAGVTYDSAKGEIFVTNASSNNVSVIDDTTNTVTATIGVGTSPEGAVYDSAKGEIFVTNFSANSVSIISDSSNTVVATITVGTSPYTDVYDSGKGEIFVTNAFSNNVSVISDSTNTVVATITVGTQPFGAAYDSGTHEIFVTNSAIPFGVSVIDDTTNTVVATITVGTGPFGAAYDSAKHEMFVTNRGDNTVSVIDDGFTSSSPSSSSGHDVTTYHPPSLGNDYYYKYGSGFTLNGKSFDITKYGITIPQQVLKTGQADNFTFKIYDERGGNTISHLGMYIHFKGDASVANSDTSFVWDKHDGVKITDPEKMFTGVNVTRHYDGNFAYVSIKFTPVKTMPDSSILMRMWDDKLASIDLPINGAIIIVDPNAPVPVQKVPDNHYGDYITLQNILDKDGYDIPSILHKQYVMQQVYSSIDINWVYDKGVDKLTMVESDKSGNMIGEEVYSLFKKTDQPVVTDHNYVYIPTQLNRQDANVEQAAMQQESQRAEKYLTQISYVVSTPNFVPSDQAAPILGDYAYSKASQLYEYDHQGEDNAVKAEAEKAVKLVESLGLVRQNNFENLSR